MSVRDCKRLFVLEFKNMLDGYDRHTINNEWYNFLEVLHDNGSICENTYRRGIETRIA